MAAPEVAVAYVSIVPSLRGFQRTLRNQIIAPSRRVGEDAGRQTGQGFNRGLQRMTGAVRHTFTDFTAGFRSAEAAASRFTGRMGTLGGVSRRALNPAIQQVSQFSAGFRDAQVAASRFSGVMGTLGGATRRAINPAVSAVGRFAGGFRSAQVAASSFSGRLGTLGGITRRVMNPLITGTRAVGSALTSAGRVAGSALGTVGRGFQAAGRAAASVGGSIRNSLSRPMDNARQSIGVLGGAFTRFGGMAAGAIAGIGIATLGRSALSAASDIQQTSASMAGLYGNTKDAEDMMRKLRDYSRDKPLETQSLYDAGKNLAYLGLKGDGALKVVQNVGTALMASGNTSKDAMSQVTGALLSMQSAGQLYAADIQKVSDQMVPAWDLLASHMGMSIKEVREEVTAGNLTVDDFVEALQAGDGDYFAMMRKSAGKTSQTFSAQFAVVKDNLITTLGETLLPLVDKAAPAMGRLGTSMNSGLKAIPGVLSRVGSALKDSGITDGFVAIVDSVRKVASGLAPAFAGFGAVMKVAFGATLVVAGTALRGLAAALSWVGDLMAEHKTIVATFGAAIGGAVAGIVAIKAAMFGFRTAMLITRAPMLAVAAAQAVMNAVMAVNPITLVVVALAALAAGLVYAWKNSETFRNIVIGAWNGIKAAALAVWNGALKPIIDGIVTGYQWVVDAAKAVGGALSTAWSAVGTAFSAVGNAITTALKAIASAATWLWNTILKPVFNFIDQAIRILATAITVVLVGPWIVGFKLISAIVMWAWNNAIKPYFNLIMLYFKAVGAAAMWLYKNAILPAFNFIVSRAKWMYNSGIKPAFDLFMAASRQLGKWVIWLYNNAVKPTFAAIVRGIKSAWYNGVKPAFNAFINGLKLLAKWARWLYNSAIKPTFQFIVNRAKWMYNSGIKPAFQWIVNRAKWLYNSGIKPTGNAIRKAFTAITTAVKKMYTGGIKPAFGWVADRARWVWSKGVKPAFEAMKRGVSAVANAFKRGKDLIGRQWSKLTSIAKKPVNFLINTVYTKGIKRLWDKVASAFGAKKLPAVSGFASGGILPGYTPGRDVHMAALSGGEAVMRPEWTRAMGPGYVNTMNAAAKSGGVGAIKRMTQGGMPAFKDGGIFGWVKKTGTMLKGAGSSAWDGIKKAASWLKDSIYGSVKAGAKAIVNPLINQIPGGGQYKGLIKAIPKKALSEMFDYSKQSDSKLETAIPSGIPGGSGVKRWTPFVLKALAMLGQPRSYLGITLRRMNQESGGNARAINNWDINAKNGMASRGLMQVIPPTFNAYAGKLRGRGIWDPLANIYASMRYALSRYGSLPRAYNRAGGYDSGGYLQPGDNQVVYNRTGRPEPVLTAKQWSDISTLAAQGAAGGLQPGDRLVLTLDGRTELEAYVDRRADNRIKRGLVTPAALGRSM